MRPIILALAMLMACETAPEETDDTEVLVYGPEVSWEVPESVAEGEDLALDVLVTDPDGDEVASVIAFYRLEGRPTWDQISLTAGEGDAWSATIPGEDIEDPALEVYFRAEDGSVYESVAFTPTGGDDDPYSIDVSVEGQALPWTETFEDGEDADSLYDLGWSDHQDGFAGYPWDISSAKAHDGDWSLLHRRGYDGMKDEMDDWAVSPALDFSATERIQVTWWEYGSSVDEANHELYISVGSPDPADGEYTLVTALAAPSEGEWARSELVDLTDYSGSSPVYLAWRYTGGYGDTWYLDDIEVRELTADLDVLDVSWSPETIAPGDTVTVSVDVENLTDIDAEGVTWTGTVDEDAGSFAGSVSQDVAGDGTATVELTLTVSEDYPDNAYLPFDLEATDGVSTWVFEDLTLLVGEASVATISWTLDREGEDTADTGMDGSANTLIVLGVGDPDAPDVSIEVVSDVLDLDSYSEVIDITDYYDYLPAGPGDLRWWVSIESGAYGELTDFSIAFAGETVTSDDLGSFDADDETWFYLPRPPEPGIDDSVTDPSVVAPGDSVVWTVDVDNWGAETTGVTTVELVSDDGDVTVVDGGPFTLSDSDGWPEGSLDTVEFTFDVSSDHVDSEPVQLTLLFTDEAESFEVDASVDVPWPVFEVTAVAIDEGDDELLDNGETAELEIQLTNLGDLDSFGKVDCVLSQTGGAATIDVDVAEGGFGSISADDSEDENDFTVTVTSGSSGDDLQLTLDCQDDDATYSVDFELVLGESPWAWMATEYDASADAQDEPFDFKRVLYREQDGVLWFELQSWEPFEDASDLFVEAWMSSTGSDYSWYNLVYQYGNGSWRGYDSGVWTTFDDPQVEVVDEYTLRLGVDLTDVGFAVDSVSVGWGSGFCGGDEQFCDHYPDGWGSPYQGWDYTLWYDIDW